MMETVHGAPRPSPKAETVRGRRKAPHSYMPSHLKQSSQAWEEGRKNGFGQAKDDLEQPRLKNGELSNSRRQRNNHEKISEIDSSKSSVLPCEKQLGNNDKHEKRHAETLDKLEEDKAVLSTDRPVSVKSSRRKRTSSTGDAPPPDDRTDSVSQRVPSQTKASTPEKEVFHASIFEPVPKCQPSRSQGKPSKRSMSDLGFRNDKPSLSNSRSRTLSLLKHPAFRNRIAQSLHLDPEETDFEREVCERLSSKVEESLCEPLKEYVESVELRRPQGRSKNIRLCCSTSDLGFLQDLQSKSTKEHEEAKTYKKEPDSSSEQTNDALGSVSHSMEIRKSQLSAFKIPSFEEFKAKGRQRTSRPLSELSVPKVATIQEEECVELSEDSTNPSLCSHPGTSHGPVTTPAKNRPLQNESEQNRTEVRMEYPVPKERKKRNNRPARNTVLGISESHSQSLVKRSQSLEGGLDHDIQAKELSSSDFKVPNPLPSEVKTRLPKASSCECVASADEQRKLRQRQQRKKCHSETLHEPGGLSGNYVGVTGCQVVKNSQKKSRGTKVKERIMKFPLFRSQSETNMNKVASEVMKKTESVSTILSDYASDSNAEYSDELEDIFPEPLMQKPSAKVKQKHAKSHQKLAQDRNEKANLMRNVCFSDSGCLVDRSLQDLSSVSELDHSTSSQTMWRSSSDISGMFPEHMKQRKQDRRRAKLCKSDPLNNTEKAAMSSVDDSFCSLTRRDSKEDILNFLDEMKSGPGDHGNAPAVNRQDKYKRATRRERRLAGKPPRAPSGRRKAAAEVDRADSGVGQESRSPEKHSQICCDCDDRILPPSPEHTDDGRQFDDLCSGCLQKRRHRKEAILEMVETEQNYGKDLQITVEQFYKPMKLMDSLLTADQIQTIFSNLPELVNVNEFFMSRLNKDLVTAAANRDESLQAVNIGQIFLESTNMLLAYESYCINQSAAPVLLDQVMEGKELLRIFLEVAQQERSVLRRMDLKAFLMLPVQRVMKYPLLLNRIYKATPLKHPDRDYVLQARHKIENILELINFKTISGSVKLRRKVPSLRRSGEFDVAFENIETHKVAMEALGWDRSNLHFLCSGRLLCTPIPDHPVGKKTKTLKFTPVYGLLVTLGKYPPYDERQKHRPFSRPSPVENAALVIVKEKAGKYQPFREPFPLKQSVIAVDPESTDMFEIHEALKDGLLLKGENSMDTDHWYQLTRMLVRDLNCWRRRRNALANIMLQDT